MKKLIAIISAAIISIVAFAAICGDNTKTASCKIGGVPGAYITAEATFFSGRGVQVDLRSYGVSEAGVTVEISYVSTSGAQRTEEKMGYIEDGKGQVWFNAIGNLQWVKISNAVCR